MTSKKPNPKPGEGNAGARARGDSSDTIFVSDGKSEEQSASQRSQRKQKASQIADISGRTTGTQVMPQPSENSVRKFVGDKYEIRSCLGQGGMSVVYKAWDHLLKRNVAIKVLSRKRSLSGKAIDRFVQEAQATSQLDHPNLIKVYEFANPKDGEPYLVMDYLEGWSLNDTLPDEGFDDVDRAVKIIAQVLSGLKHAHRKNVIHRDLKPSNIMLVTGDDGEELVKIVDFGIAKIQQPDASGKKLTETGEVFGSPLYMSPEQCRGEKLDARSDIYSCACVIYEIFVGTPPFMGANFMDTLHLHMHEEAEPLARLRPDLADASRFDSLLKKALAKDPAQRYQTIDEMADEFHKIPIVRKVLSEPAPDAVRASSRQRKIALAALALLLIFAGKELFDVYADVNPDSWAARWLASLGGGPRTSEVGRESFVAWNQNDNAAQRDFDQGNYNRAGSRFEEAINAAAQLPESMRGVAVRISKEEFLDLEYVLGVLKGQAPMAESWRRDQAVLSRQPDPEPYVIPPTSKQEATRAAIRNKTLGEALALNREAMKVPDAGKREELFERARTIVFEMAQTGVSGASRVTSEQARYYLSREGPERSRKAIETSLSVLPAGNPALAADRAIMLLTLARLEAENGNEKGALSTLESANDLAYGVSSEDIVASDLIAGWRALGMSEYDLANRTLNQGLAHAEALLPRNYDLTALALELLGNCNLGRVRARKEAQTKGLNQSLDDNERATTAYYKRALAIRMRATRFDSSAILIDFDTIDDICTRDTYEPLLLAGIEYLKELDGDDSARAGTSRQAMLRALWLNNVAEGHLNRQDYKVAEKYLKQALSLIDGKHIQEHNLVASVVKSLVTVAKGTKNQKEIQIFSTRLKELTDK